MTKKLVTLSTSDKAIRAISLACRFPFLSGRPDTTMYASPIVSTCQKKTHICKLTDQRHSANLLLGCSKNQKQQKPRLCTKRKWGKGAN